MMGTSRRPAGRDASYGRCCECDTYMVLDANGECPDCGVEVNPMVSRGDAAGLLNQMAKLKARGDTMTARDREAVDTVITYLSALRNDVTHGECVVEVAK